MPEIKKELPSRFDAERLGKNIRAYRVRSGLSQSELADRLFVTPHSVSKWERGENIPDLTRFCRLARELSVSLDILAGGQPKEKTYIGIDGGGTKTEFVLVNEQGNLLGTIILGPSNPNVCGIDATYNVVRQGIDFFCPQDINVQGICFGGAGLGTGNHAKDIRERLSKAYPNIKVDCGSDILNVIDCSSQPDNCIAAICGTGSTVFGMNDGQLVRTGGGGYLFDRSGSGYDMGRSAIMAALEERDGTGAATRLTALVEEKIGGDVWSHITELYKKDVAYIASFAPLVQQACREDDPVACEIMQKNVAHLAKLIAVCQKKAPKARVLVMAGSHFQKNEVFQRQIKGQLDPALKIELLNYPPVWGACLRCMRVCGVSELPTPEHFMKEYWAKRKEEEHAEDGTEK